MANKQLQLLSADKWCAAKITEPCIFARQRLNMLMAMSQCTCATMCINCAHKVSQNVARRAVDLLPVSWKSMTVHYLFLGNALDGKKSMGRHCFVPAKQLKRQMAYTGRQQQRTTRQTLNTTAPRQQQQQYGGQRTTSKWCTLMAVTFLNFYDSSLSATVWVSECESVCEWVSGCERVSECELARVGAYVSVHGGKGLNSTINSK